MCLLMGSADDQQYLAHPYKQLIQQSRFKKMDCSVSHVLFLCSQVDIVPATSSLLAEDGPRTSSLLKSYVQTASDQNIPIVINEVVVPVIEFDNVVVFIDHWGWWGGGWKGGWWGWCGHGYGWCWGR
jgi:hypothetical protein